MTRRTGLVLGVVALLVGWHLTAIPIGGAAFDDGRPDSVAEIDDRLEDETGELTVLVHFGASAEGIDDADPEAVPDQLRARADRDQAALREFAATSPHVTVERRFWIANVALVTVDTDAVPLTEIAAIDGVEYVGPNPTVRTESMGRLADGQSASVDRVTANDTVADDGTASNSWALDQIKAPEVWDEYDTRGEGMRVAVLDTGADGDHPDVDVAAWGDWTKRGYERDTDPQDYDTAREPSGHGTHVSALVTGGDASGVQIGTAPEADLMVGAVMTDCDADGCVATAAQILSGLQWAVENGADVATLSIGLSGHHSDFVEAIRWAQASGTIVVASVGNDGVGTVSSPGSEYDPISVGASNITGEILNLSSGKDIDTEVVWGSAAPDDWPDQYVVPTVTAPGWYIASAVVGGQWSRASGTSQAAPHVAGGIALIQAATDEELSPAEMRDVLVDTAGKPDGAPEGQDVRWGHGIVNLQTAMEAAVAGDYDVEDPPPEPDTSIDVTEPVDGPTTFDWYLTDAAQTVTITVEPGSGETFEAGGEAVVTVDASGDAVTDELTVRYDGEAYDLSDGSAAIPLDADGVRAVTLEHAAQTASFDLQVEPGEEPQTTETTAAPETTTAPPETTQGPDAGTTEPSDAEATEPPDGGTTRADDPGTAGSSTTEAGAGTDTSNGDTDADGTTDGDAADENGEDGTDGGAPGFGALVGITGTLVALVALRRRS